MAARAGAFRDLMQGRRTVRTFSRDPVPRQVIEDVLETAGAAPSGAHKQPWTFVAVSDPGVKRRMREASRPGRSASTAGTKVPDLKRKTLPEFTEWITG